MDKDYDRYLAKVVSWMLVGTFDGQGKIEFIGMINILLDYFTNVDKCEKSHVVENWPLCFGCKLRHFAR